MRILLTGATGYIGKRLLPNLLQKGHEVICAVRDKKRFIDGSELNRVKVIEVDFLKEETLTSIPQDIDAAYYLIHSMSGSKDFATLESLTAQNFRKALSRTRVQQVIYLSGIINEEKLSDHLQSRKNVEIELSKGNYHLTTCRAGIIIGSGSASFEIMRDLVEKLPVMVAPKWLNTRCQPIGIFDVLQILSKTLNKEATYDQSFDIGGPDILTYKEMLLGLAQVRGLKRRIWTIPVMTPRLSSYWLYFVTSTSYKLAVALVDSMKVEVVCEDDRLLDILEIEPLSYKDCLERTFNTIQNSLVPSSWKDSMSSGVMELSVDDFVEVPTYGCFVDQRQKKIVNRQLSIDKIWSIGGTNGWYYANFLWKIRGAIDKLFGGVGLRRGRTNQESIHVGDALDFWRVLYADREEGRLLLFAEMKVPGEAWLEFKILDDRLIQTATFRPKGILGRLYWYAVLPFHGLVFNGLINNLVNPS